MLGKTSASRRAGLFLEHHGSSRCFTQPQGQLHIRQCSFSTGVVVVASPCGSDCALPLRQPASSACFGATPQLPSKRRIQTPPRLVVDRVKRMPKKSRKVCGLKGNIHRAKPGSHTPAQLLSLSVSALCTYLASVVARCSHRAARLLLRAVRSPRRAALSSAVRAPCRASLLGAARSAAPSSEGCSAVSARCCTFSSSLLGAARSS